MKNIKGKKVYVVEIIERAFSEDINLKKGAQIMWAEGMLGVMPVFDSEENAKKHYPKNDFIYYEIK